MRERYLNFWAGEKFCEKNYVYGGDYEGVFLVDLEDGTYEDLYIDNDYRLVNEDFRASCMKYNMAFRNDEEIWFVPAFETEHILIFNCIDQSASYMAIPNYGNSWSFRAFCVLDDYLWLFPYSYGRILKINIKKRIIEQVIECSDYRFLDGTVIDNKVFLCQEKGDNSVRVFDVNSGKLSDLSDEIRGGFVRIREYDGRILIFPQRLKDGIVIFDLKTQTHTKKTFGEDEGFRPETEIAGCIIDKDYIYISTNIGDETITVLEGVNMVVKKKYYIETRKGQANYCYDLRLGDNNVFCPINSRYPAIVMKNGLMKEVRIELDDRNGLRWFLKLLTTDNKE